MPRIPSLVEFVEMLLSIKASSNEDLIPLKNSLDT